MQFYSQIGQDRYLYETYFKNRRGGVFLDIGAYDGVKFSNSCFFERELGWSGICIEPLPEAFAKLKAERSAVCLNCCVSDVEGMVDFAAVDVGADEFMWSGILKNYDQRHVQRIRRMKRQAKLLKIPSRRIDDILAENAIVHIDYASIDTEGSELLILQTLDFARFPIDVLSVENNYQDQTIVDLLAAKGYDRVNVFHGYDDLYVRRGFVPS